ncbi:MAG: sigma 54-interacting transcriptional regulator [Lentihominibacter sp.]|jgi:transcriptional regulator with PAS, ATPase and Fis domain
MQHYFEYTMHLGVNTSDKSEIISIFERCKSFQLPVVDDDGYLVGIVNLFDIIRVSEPVVDLKRFLKTDFYVAGEKEGVFSFKLMKQDILPFVDLEGKYKGFSNKITMKCYIPGRDYIKMVEMKQPDSFSSGEITDDIPNEVMDDLDKCFDAIIEDNYEGVYVTVDKGKTFALNNNAYIIEDITKQDDLKIDDEDLRHFDEVMNPKVKQANIIQIMQERNEISLMRVTSDMFDIPKMRKEFVNMQDLAAQYKKRLDELEAERDMTQTFVCKSNSMKKIMDLILQISSVDASILLQGESGVGKGLISETIHKHSMRKEKPFVKIDCAAIPSTLLESELFGYEKGAFTGAEKNGKKGLVEMADGGTLFLDEIGELPLELQTKLLSMLQERAFYKVGGVVPITVDVRIISASNRDLNQMVLEGTFRSDLYYRLKVIPINIPPLVERKEDIRYLIDFYLKRYNEQYGCSKILTRPAYRILQAYKWPGNVRELQHVIEYLVVTTAANLIQDDEVMEAIGGDISTSIHSNGGEQFLNLSYGEAYEKFEKQLLYGVMRNSTNTQEMAEELEVDRSTITRKMKRYNIVPNFGERNV